MDPRLATQALLFSLYYRVVNTHQTECPASHTPARPMPVRKQTAVVLMLVRNVGKLKKIALSLAQNRHNDAVSG